MAADQQGAFEFRVWGSHKKARKKLAQLANESTSEEFEDCYLLVDDPNWNAKIRDNTLKIKRLVSEKKGFEQWASDRHRTKKSAPSPFDAVFADLRLDRPQRGKSFNLRKQIAKLDPDSGVRPVFVTKRRRRYRIGDVRAEVTDIEIHDSDDVLRTLSIQGDDLGELRRLRKKLGVGDEPNIAMHQVIESELAELDD